MSRPVVLSNNQIFVGLDKYGLVNDFYFPFVGQENLTTARNCHHKIGIYVDGTFSWVNDGNWDIVLNYEENTLISHITMSHHFLNVSLEFNDYIDPEFNTYVRHIKILNSLDRDREIRLFMHQVFIISPVGRADTVLYVPNKNYIYDYNGHTSLVINGRFTDGTSFDQYSTGNYHVEGKIGTYKDAEDGELSNNPIEHSSVDSTIRFSKVINANQFVELDYWVIITNSQSSASDLNDQYMSGLIDERLDYTRHYWQEWTNADNYPDLNYKTDITKSLLIIKAHIDKRGSIIASGDSSIFNYGKDYYAYCWPRDASFALWPLIRMGHLEESKNFFEFCKSVIQPGGYIMQKYQPDQSIGSTWLPSLINNRAELAIQEDETAIVIFMLNQYYEASKDLDFIKNCYDSLIAPAANFMSSYIDVQTGLPHASYDLWEEKFLTTTYTTSIVMAALSAAINLANKIDRNEFVASWQETLDLMKNNFHKFYNRTDKFFIKGFILQSDGSIINDNTIDISSFYGAYMFSGLRSDDKHILTTLNMIEDNIKNVTPSGGVLRYNHDSYFLKDNSYPGNPWVIATLWLAQYYIISNNLSEADSLIQWVISKQGSTGCLSEQYDPVKNLAIGVDPLVWSQVELVNTLLDLNNVK